MHRWVVLLFSILLMQLAAQSMAQESDQPSKVGAGLLLCAAGKVLLLKRNRWADRLTASRSKRSKFNVLADRLGLPVDHCVRWPVDDWFPPVDVCFPAQ
jgi:hypothetical protein